MIILINYIFFIGNLFNQDSLILNSNLIEVISLIFLVLSFFAVGFYDDRNKLSP